MRQWDVESGRLERVMAAFNVDGRPGHAVWDPVARKILFVTEDAWRFLFWQYLDENGERADLPYEIDSPLPAGRADAGGDAAADKALSAS